MYDVAKKTTIALSVIQKGFFKIHTRLQICKAIDWVWVAENNFITQDGLHLAFIWINYFYSPISQYTMTQQNNVEG